MSKKILFIWQNLDHGGGEIALINLLEKLCATSYQLDVLCYEDINKFSIPNGVNVYFAAKPTANKLRKSWNKVIFLCKWLRIAKNYDLSIINEVPFLAIMAMVVSFFCRTKYLLWVHSCRGDMGSGFGKLAEFIYKKSLLYADCIVCVSKVSAKSMKDYVELPLKRMVIIYNVLKFTPLKVDSLKLPEDLIKICAVGRLTYEKNFSLLIDALALARPKLNHPVHLYICGSGKEFGLLENKIKHSGLSQSITLTGHVNNALSYIQECNIFVSTSDAEALPTVVFEALHYNKPVIATKTGAAEILANGKYGIIIKKGNLGQLTKALITLINNKDIREEYALKSYNALDRFDTTGILKQWNKLIEYYI